MRQTLNQALNQVSFILNEKRNKNSYKPAFTIIEVVLVLAIAGLIFLMVFIALLALQRNQRDAQRKRDADRVLAAIQAYQANNRGQAPGDGIFFRGEFMANYMKVGGDEFKTPTGEDYTFAVDPVRSVENMLTHQYREITMWVWHYGRCDNGAPVRIAGVNNIAVAVVLEGGGIYCINN